ncbi:rhomboid family intramembrane serine protease [Leptospira kmetyi]|uniref:Rhomboid family intramembrane serine protease n=1 Tax=Leptospira kmetyi TaxID=408139 RepID=A0A2M9XL96_9LEPT|nr:rhomboid family intramembrane serine protease [Leptospira kmetyi]AYV55152.1 rhomboid family intramembrane serine protease [Leptospira kmetyi]EQA52542.1 peptidase, S54 family [Leptospira kmetyi serovar Malaysia str. Bejo-Iso9]PJZ30247.1 rhomboid family intramembrane serine protease [Leptospira kmetyi]PJZ40023.1 rhomboid family intramembrane serine protease [Leptospira kmetyi]TGL70350.1 rhomboid family intramembrane serine protease [Leptospira kmetyi]
MLIFEKANFLGRIPFITFFLIGLMCLLNLLGVGDLHLSSSQIDSYHLVASIFGHANFLHFLGNAFYLYMYGDNVEDVLGHVVYLCLFVLLGVVANFAFISLHIGEEYRLIGASGAISGILGLYYIFFPKVKTNVVIPIRIPYSIFEEYISLDNIPVSWSFVFWFVIQIAFTIRESFGVLGIAFSAHAGGFLAGTLIGILFKRIGFLDRHSERLNSLKMDKMSILCPSCNTPKKIPRYGRYKCGACECEFFFDSKGKRILIP